jgi:hypothetical protein
MIALVSNNPRLRALVLVFFLCVAKTSYSFPEMVRAGYANCVTCHQSPTGGGLLTPYGRALSGEVLSSWTSEGEERFLYFVSPPDWLNLGGDVRALGLYQNRAAYQSAQFIFMQADVEAGVNIGPVSAVATAGIDNDGNAVSRRHYLQFRATDELQFRVGKFLPAFGIYTENHSVAINRGIGRDQGTETYNVEAAWIAKDFDVFATGILGRPDNLNLGAETGAALSSSLTIDNRYKMGLSYYYGTRDIEHRHIVGPFGILGFTPHFFLLVDADLQYFIPTTLLNINPQTGFIDYVRLDYEIFQGFHLYVTQELTVQDLTNSAGTLSDAYGIGAQFFPRPHLELNMLFERQRFGGAASPFASVAFAMMHFYL